MPDEEAKSVSGPPIASPQTDSHTCARSDAQFTGRLTTAEGHQWPCQGAAQAKVKIGGGPRLAEFLPEALDPIAYRAVEHQPESPLFVMTKQQYHGPAKTLVALVRRFIDDRPSSRPGRSLVILCEGCHQMAEVSSLELRRIPYWDFIE